MRIVIEINDQSGHKITERRVAPILRRLERLLVSYDFPSKTYELSLAIVGEPEIRKLNRWYRSINKPTDVLSFSEFPNQASIRKQKDKKVFLGEVILCYDNINRYARSEKINFEKELAKVFAHGILHLFGFRHGLIMKSLQEKAKGNK